MCTGSSNRFNTRSRLHKSLPPGIKSSASTDNLWESKNEVKSSESGKRETAPAPVLNKGNLGDVCTFQFSAHLQILSLCEEHLQRQPQHSEGHSMMTAAAALT
jgi:hypothetical protein